MSKEDLKSEMWNRIVKSWASTLLGVGLVISMVVLGVIDKIEWETAYGWLTVGVGLVTKKDSLLTNRNNS